MDDMDYYEYEESKKTFTAAKIIKFIFKLIAAVIIIGTFALLFGRMYFMKIPKAFTGLTWTPNVVEAFEAGKLEVELQEVYEPYADKGLYHISNTAVVYSENEVQFTVRYNDRSTINKLMRIYSLDERPEGEVFVYILSDNNGNTYTEYTYAETERMIHQFRRVIFSNVDLTNVETLYLDVYYGEDVRKPIGKEQTMHASFVIYDKEYSVGKTEFKKAGKTSLVFTERPVYLPMLDE